MSIAKERNCITLVTDYDLHAHAKKVVDDSYVINVLDVDSICIMARKEYVEKMINILVTKQ